SVMGRLLLGWGIGFLVSVLGLASSFAWDLPTGAAVVTMFGVLMAAVALGLGALRLRARLRREGPRALAAVGAVTSLLVALAGLLLALFPRMDHHWLDWLERAAPSVQVLFLTAGERRTYHDTRADVIRQAAELERMRAMQQDAQWGRRAMTPEA